MLIAKESKPLCSSKRRNLGDDERYLGAREEPSSFASYGTWARTADKLVLTDSKGEKSYYRAKGDALEMLDREGNPIESQFNYTLEPAQSSLSHDTDDPAGHVFLYG